MSLPCNTSRGGECTRQTQQCYAGPESLGEIAGRIGYEAKAAFSKAFKRWAGHAPGAYRQSSRMAAANPAG